MDFKEKSSNVSNKKYQELIEIPNAVIFQLDKEWNYIALNKKWTDITDYTIEEALGTPFLSYVKAEEQSSVEEQLKALLEGSGDGILKEFKLVSKQGKEEKVHLFLKIDFDKNQEIASFSGTITGLSSRKTNIEAFHNNIINYQLISENISDMVAVLAEDGLALYASPSHTTVLGFELDDYVGSYPLKHIHPDDWENMFHFFHKMVSTWSTLGIEYRCMNINGDWLDLEMKGTPIKGPNGEIQVISVSRDITARKKAEEELRQTTIKFETLIASLPYGVKVEDATGEVTLFNDAYLNIFPKSNTLDDQQLLVNEAQHMMKDYDSYLREKKNITKNLQTHRSEEIQLINGRTIERDSIPMMDGGLFDGYLWIFEM
ncbi:hypothetical protein CR203_14940 [Salipaludibacillus neizhouensis]|uniref:histidine kinase n=1 Tax=Salipaludibacillus neizhouensis TaxID=885475 RepID=A0A3A9K892_9BACI|nr:PAS domain-containing protein [Salipaludibacillus neizhouensis]RKL66581.1 hypothetical protein CR203_14940 [Salipaludibacillus neizhouensis]